MTPQTDRLPRRVTRHLDDLIDRRPELAGDADHIVAGFRLLDECARSGNVIYTCGNGGSAADSEHIAAELVKGFEHQRPLDDTRRDALATAGLDEAVIDKLQAPIACVPLTGFIGLRTAVANDTDAALEFAQLALALVKPGDVLVAISTSGNSANIVHAARVAHANGGSVLSLTNEDGGQLATLADAAIRAPVRRTLEVQEYHLPIYHTLALMLESSLFESEK